MNFSLTLFVRRRRDLREQLLSANIATLDGVVYTHAHADHSALSRQLAKTTKAPVIAFGDHQAGQSEIMVKWAPLLNGSGGEGVDTGFYPDELLGDGESVDISGVSITGLWTPGHFGNHMCFEWQDCLFTGDLVMGWASSVVSPPDGDLRAYLHSVSKLAARTDRIYYPGHGAPIYSPQNRARWLIDHRRARTEQILKVLDRGPADCPTITQHVYRDLDVSLIPAAQRNVLAHLIDLLEQNLVSIDFQGDLQTENQPKNAPAIFVKK